MLFSEAGSDSFKTHSDLVGRIPLHADVLVDDKGLLTLNVKFEIAVVYVLWSL
jgi:hypothetical protein